MATTIRSAIDASMKAEDQIRAEISELFLLLKSGRLTSGELELLKNKLDHLIGETKKRHDEHQCCE